MREPGAKRRPLIDLEEFERRLRQPSSTNRRDDDPLVELARLPGGREDPYKTVFEPRAPQLEQTWDDSALQGHYPPERLDAPEDLFGGDFAAIEAGLLGATRQDPAPSHAELDEAHLFAGADLGSAYWPHEDSSELTQPGEGGDDEIRSKIPLYLMAATIVVGIVGIGACFAFKGSASGPREIATIKAVDGPVRI